MAYRKPFTNEQPKEATHAFRSLKKNFSVLRRFYRPVTEKQRSVFAEYRVAIVDIATELEKPNASVDVAALTRADAAARWLAVEYQRLRIIES